MSLVDKKINMTFDETNAEEAINVITQTVYTVIKDIFTDSSLDTTIPMIYLDQEKKNGIRFGKNLSSPTSSTSNYFSIEYLVDGNSHIYNYRLGFNYKTLYYNISIDKSIIAFGFDFGCLDFGIGYQEKIGFLEFFIGNFKSGIDQEAHLFLSSYDMEKMQSNSASGANTRWTSSDFPHLSLIQLPLFIQQGNFSSLYEIISCNAELNFSVNTTFFSYEGKYYRLIHTSMFSTGGAYVLGKARNVVLAMEVADD